MYRCAVKVAQMAILQSLVPASMLTTANKLDVIILKIQANN